MSCDVIIAEGLGKRFDVRARRRLDARRFDAEPGSDRHHDDFWALRGIELSLPAGSTLGVVGPNGAGKSTLLRLIAGITPPSEGTLRLIGRVGSLLEVGAGFMADLSGRDNVELSGAILGMRRSAIRRHFDEIVAFAGVEAFIDLPVKRYSSGMYLRLAFAVAAHLDAELLLIDEALAVGDRQFREKCLERIRTLAADGRTTLFVSHDAHSISRLCDRALLLQHGRAVCQGDVAETLRQYTDATTPVRSEIDRDPVAGRSSIVHAAVDRPDGAWRDIGQPLDVRLSIDVAHDDVGVALELELELIGPDSWPVSGSVTSFTVHVPGVVRVRCLLPALRLTAGHYGARLTLRRGGNELDAIRGLGPIEVWETAGVGKAGWRYAEDAAWDVESSVGVFADLGRTGRIGAEVTP